MHGLYKDIYKNLYTTQQQHPIYVQDLYVTHCLTYSNNQNYINNCHCVGVDSREAPPSGHLIEEELSFTTIIYIYIYILLMLHEFHYS